MQDEPLEITLDPAQPTAGGPSRAAQFIVLKRGAYSVTALKWTDSQGTERPSAWTSFPLAPKVPEEMWMNFFYYAVFFGDGTIGKSTVVGTGTRYREDILASNAFPKNARIIVPPLPASIFTPMLLWIPSDWHNEHGRLRLRLAAITVG